MDSKVAARFRYGTRFESFLAPQRRGFFVKYSLEMDNIQFLLIENQNEAVYDTFCAKLGFSGCI